MKILKSIKWRLQLWYGLILVLVLAGFGVTAYQFERGRQLGRIDEELHRRIGILANALHRPPPRRRIANRPPLGQLPREQEIDGPLLNAPPPGQFPDDGPPEQNPFREFALPQQDAHIFDASDPNGFYFIIRSRGGNELARSTNAPLVVYDSKAGPYGAAIARQLPEKHFEPQPSRMIGARREQFSILPSGETILVGCSIASELRELRRTAVNLTAVGGLILLVGLAGGWWLVSRAIKPISRYQFHRRENFRR